MIARNGEQVIAAITAACDQRIDKLGVGQGIGIGCRESAKQRTNRRVLGDGTSRDPNRNRCLVDVGNRNREELLEGQSACILGLDTDRISAAAFEVENVPGDQFISGDCKERIVGIPCSGDEAIGVGIPVVGIC